MNIATGLRLVAALGLLGTVGLLGTAGVVRAELTIDWANRATAGFTAAEEGVIDASILLWKQVLPTSINRTVTLNVTREALGGPISTLSGVQQNALGNPVAGSIAIESSVPFFVDLTPLDNSEYAPSTEHPGFYAAIGGDAIRNFDLLSLMTHQLGHMLGFLSGFDRFGSRVHPVTPQLFQGEGFSVPLAADLSHTEDQHDLMNAEGIFLSERILPSAVDAAILNDAFDYKDRQIYNYAGSTLDIPDESTTPFYLNVTDQGTITDVDVALRIQHPAGADLELTLVSPQGTRVTLSAHQGAGADYGTAGLWSRFDDEAIRYPLASGGSPFDGTYQAEGLLSVLNGQNTAGIWTLEVNDSVAPNAGTLVGFSLIFASSPITAHAGDFDGDGDVDGADFVVWQTNFPFTPAPAIAPVPEPAAILLCLIGCAVIRAARSRQW